MGWSLWERFPKRDPPEGWNHATLRRASSVALPVLGLAGRFSPRISLKVLPALSLGGTLKPRAGGTIP